MGWSLEDIERDWIGGEVSAIAASPDSVVAAFDRTERALGREWIEKARVGVGNSFVRGPVPPFAQSRWVKSWRSSKMWPIRSDS